MLLNGIRLKFQMQKLMLKWLAYKLNTTTMNTNDNEHLAYAPLSEQLDMQYWDAMNNTETWLDHIRSVKEAHPKEGE
jgi:hypothetical protein